MPLITEAPESARRHALVIGTATYLAGWDDIGQGVRTEMAAAKRLCLQFLSYQSKTFAEIHDPDSTLSKEVAVWRANISPGPDDWILVYYTGHGVERGGALHLITRDVPTNMVEAAPTAQTLVSALLGGDKMPGHVLLVLDTCYSATAQFDAMGQATRLREAAGGRARGADFHLITTTRSVETAVVGHFMQALSDVITNGRAAGAGEEFVQLSTAIERVNQLLSQRGGQRASYSGAGETALRFLPNPGWVPTLRLNMGREERRRVLYSIQAHALRAHWDPRARGVSTERDPGWFFTGRGNAMRHLIRWTTAGVGGLIVKGRPGSGKSAVLARLATLADPDQREAALKAGALDDISEDEIPPLNVIDAAIHARAKDPARIALEIGTALNLELSGTDAEVATANALAARPERTVLLIDALDEAINPNDVALFLRSLLQGAINLVLIVGLRESGERSGQLTERLGRRFDPIDLDGAQWREPNDMVRYVERYLRATPDSTYADMEPDPLSTLADAIALRAGTSFLVASATAHALAARATIVDPAKLKMPASVGEAFELDLTRFTGTAGKQLRQILTALACGEGRGLPAPEWIAIARALSDGDTTAADIDRWINDAGFYIVADSEFQTPVRRLYHEEFATYLRGDTNPQCEADVATALVSCMPGPDWNAASSYVLAYYPKHLWRAARARELSELASSTAWAKAKRERFEDPTLILSDLDLAIDIARRAQPPDLQTIIRACMIHVGFVTTAPPIVIDVLAGVGQLTRAELMAEAIQFPLDRCQAFSFLAARYAKAGQYGRSHACVRAAEQAARCIHGGFQSLAFYWVLRAARAIGQAEPERRIRDAVHLTLGELAEAFVKGEASDQLPTGIMTREAAAKVWGPQTGRLDTKFILPHWLFWAAMCLRELADADGLVRIRDILRASRPFGNNLALQTAAVSGDVEYLRAVELSGFVKPGNLALALVEANLVPEFDALHAAGAFAHPGPEDAAKRFAWALARRGDFEKALEISATISDDPEEEARALFHVAETARVAGNSEALKRVVDQVHRLRGKLIVEHGVNIHLPSKSTMMPEAAIFARAPAKKAKGVPTGFFVEQWRIESWIAATLLLADETERATDIAETVCSFVIVPSEQTSLALATPRTAYLKGHVQLHSASGPDEGLQEQVLEVAELQGTTVARGFLHSQSASANSQAQILAALARRERDPVLWLDALIVSRAAGPVTLRDILDEGEIILSQAEDDPTSTYLLAQLRESIARYGS